MFGGAGWVELARGGLGLCGGVIVTVRLVGKSVGEGAFLDVIFWRIPWVGRYGCW